MTGSSADAAAWFSIVVIVVRKPGEYNSLEVAPPLVNNIGAACRTNKLFSTNSFLSQQS